MLNLTQIAKATAECFKNGGKLLLCGNGGSASDCGHVMSEFINGYRRLDICLPTIDLTAFTPTITSIGNDRGYDQIFTRQIQALGRPADCLWAFSTSGRSPNIVEACKLAKNRGMTVIGFFGGCADAQGHMIEDCHCYYSYEDRDSGNVQIAHSMAYHELVQLTWEMTFDEQKAV